MQGLKSKRWVGLRGLGKLARLTLPSPPLPLLTELLPGQTVPRCGSPPSRRVPCAGCPSAVPSLSAQPPPPHTHTQAPFSSGLPCRPCSLSQRSHLGDHTLTWALDYMETPCLFQETTDIWVGMSEIFLFGITLIYFSETFMLFIEFKQKQSSIKKEKKNHAKSHPWEITQFSHWLFSKPYFLKCLFKTYTYIRVAGQMMGVI